MLLFTLTEATESIANHDKNYKLAKYSLRLTENITNELKTYIYELAKNHTNPDLIEFFHTKSAFEELKCHLFSAIQILFNYDEIKKLSRCEDYSLDLFETYIKLSHYFERKIPIYANLLNSIATNELPENEDDFDV